MPVSGSPPPLLPGIMRLAITSDFGGGFAVNVLHFQLHETGGLGASDVSNMVLALGQYFANDLWKLKASNQWSVTSYDAVYALIEGQPNVKKVRLADAIAGLSSTAADFADLAFLINWETGDPRRGGKPRTYLSGVRQSDNADFANLQSADVTTLTAGCATFLGHIQGKTEGALVCDNLVDYSVINGKAYRAAGHPYIISSGSCNAVVGNQRRRVARARA